MSASTVQSMGMQLVASTHATLLTEQPRSSLMAAAAEGAVELITSLLEAGAQVSATDGDSGMCALALSAAHGHTEAAKALCARGADINGADKQGRTPLTHAVLGGHLNTAVQLALGGANVSHADDQGRNALDHAIDKSFKQLSLALLLIATGKFTRPLEPLLTMPRLQQLRGWVADRQGKNAGAMGAVLQQHATWLAPPSASAPPVSAEDRRSGVRGLLAIVAWAAQHGLGGLSDQASAHLASFVGAQELCVVRNEAGQTALHVLALAGKGETCRALVHALPRAEAVELLNGRDGAGRLAHQLPVEEVPMQARPAVATALLKVTELWQGLAEEGAAPEPAGSAPPARLEPAAAMRGGGAGRGGAVRRRSGSETPHDELSDDARSAAAGDLLQLASAASSQPASSSRTRNSRPRDNKPYQRRGKGRGGQGRECWLPGGLWWQEPDATIPTGRQPGEFAGWQPMVDRDKQLQELEQKQLLSAKEQLVQGLESRDDAINYWYRLKATCNDVELAAPHAASVPAASTEAQPITRTVDDSAVAHYGDHSSKTEYKQLAGKTPGGERWGGFRRHFVDASPVSPSARSAELATQPTPALLPPSLPPREAGDPSVAPLPLAQRLQAKKAEVLEARRMLEALLEEERQLEAELARTSMADD